MLMVFFQDYKQTFIFNNIQQTKLIQTQQQQQVKIGQINNYKFTLHLNLPIKSIRTIPPQIMFKQQQSITSQSILIPIQKLQKFYSFTGLQPKPYKLIQYRQCLQPKPKTTYGAYSAQSLIKLLRTIQNNKQDFLEILAINTTLSKNNKKEFVIDKLLRQYTLFSYRDLLEELHLIRQEKRDKGMYQQMLNFIKLVLSKIKYLLYKYCQTLVTVLGECVNFYIRKSINKQTQRPQYSIIIALDNICISFCSSNQFCQNILHSLVIKLKQHCRLDDYDLQQGLFDSTNLQTTQSNILPSNQLPQFFQQLYSTKQQSIQQQILQQQNPQVFYNNIVINFLIKYSQDIYFLIQSTIVFLANLVLEKKQLKNIAYDQQFISMKNIINEGETIGETFMNLYCEHFQGLSQEVYKNGEKCAYCGQIIIVDEVKCYQRNRNIFQNLLSRNYLNPKGENIMYYFKEKVFTLANKERYSSYPHFCQFIKKYHSVRDRPEVLMLLETQKITLYNKQWGKKKLFSCDQLIQTPVRGKYCRHLQFFQLLRVYQKYITRQHHQTSFDCFLCFQPIQYTQIMYLHQIKLIIDLVRHNFYPDKQCIMNSYIQIDHMSQKVQINSQLEKGYMRKTYNLPIYNTLIDPLTKSQRVLGGEDGSKGKKKDQQMEEFQYTEEFKNFFFGC